MIICIKCGKRRDSGNLLTTWAVCPACRRRRIAWRWLWAIYFLVLFVVVAWGVWQWLG